VLLVRSPRVSTLLFTPKRTEMYARYYYLDYSSWSSVSRKNGLVDKCIGKRDDGYYFNTKFTVNQIHFQLVRFEIETEEKYRRNAIENFNF